MDTTTIDRISEAVERELQRLREARPHLSNRIERAEHLLVTQISVGNGQRPIKVRVHAAGSRSYSVRSGSKLKREYVVNPAGFGCNCPWAASGGTGCYHSISCWVLERAYKACAHGRRHKTAKPKITRHDSLRGIVADPERLAALADKLRV